MVMILKRYFLLGVMTKKRHWRTFWNDGDVPYLDLGGGCIDDRDNNSSCSLKMYVNLLHVKKLRKIKS